jgi:hypothetical protein
VKENLADYSDRQLKETLIDLQENVFFLESGQAKIISLPFYRKIKALISTFKEELKKRNQDGSEMPKKPQKITLLCLPGRPKGN